MGSSWTASVLQERLSFHVTLDLCKSNSQNTYYSHSIFVPDHTSHDPMCWSMRSHVIPPAVDLRLAQVRQLSHTGGYKHPVEKTSRWWTSGGLVPIVPHTKKGRRTCHTFTASNIGRENQQTPSCQLYIFDSYHINESQHSAVPEGSRNTIHHSSHCCAAEKLQGTGNRGRMWGNSEKCEFGLTKTVKETLYENWRQIEKHTKS